MILFIVPIVFLWALSSTEERLGMVENPVRRIFLLKFNDKRSDAAGRLVKEDGGGAIAALDGSEPWSVILNSDPVSNSASSCIVPWLF